MGYRSRPTVRRTILGFLIIVTLSMLLTTGCRDPDTSYQSEGETKPSESLLPNNNLPVSEGLLSEGWLSVENLDQYEASLEQEAEKSGFTAAVVQPDPGVKQIFLMTAADSASVRQLNGFFYWFLDLSLTDSDRPQLLLVLDRLFSDATREAALADRLFSDPAVVSLLTYSLQQLQNLNQPDILRFILECYRREFSSRQQDLSPSGQIWKQTFNRIEVTYEAGFYNTISFYVLPD